MSHAAAGRPSGQTRATAHFQINTLFGGLSVLEKVPLAIAERTGVAGQMLRVPAKHATSSRSYARLGILRLEADALERQYAASYGASGWSRSPWRLP